MELRRRERRRQQRSDGDDEDDEAHVLIMRGSAVSLKRAKWSADSHWVLRREEGFTLVELILVMLIVAILLAIAVGFHTQARERAGDATARTNIRVAIPAIETYRADHGTYAGMTLALLQSTYSPGIQGISVLSADDAGYCVRASAGGSTWYKDGEAGVITKMACS
jgi:prepilin-type N-terminal cleavage/methylation domain-containing protein